jgi:hypothetical protein
MENRDLYLPFLKIIAIHFQKATRRQRETTGFLLMGDTLER